MKNDKNYSITRCDDGTLRYTRIDLDDKGKSEVNFVFNPDGTLKINSIIMYKRKSNKNRFEPLVTYDSDTLEGRKYLSDYWKDIPLSFRLFVTAYIDDVLKNGNI